jgi:hypothetical protein
MKRPELLIIHPTTENLRDLLGNMPLSVGHLESSFFQKHLDAYYDFAGLYKWREDNTLVLRDKPEPSLARRLFEEEKNLVKAKLVLPINDWYGFEKMTRDDGFEHFYFRANVEVEYKGKTFPAEVLKKARTRDKPFIKGVQIVQPSCSECDKPREEWELVRDPMMYLVGRV